MSLCVRSAHSSLLCEEDKVKDKKFPRQAKFHFSDWTTELSGPPRNQQCWQDKSWPLSFQREPDSLNYRWFSSPPSSLSHHPLLSPFSWSLILLTFSPSHYYPSKHLQRQRLFLLPLSICHAWNLLMELTKGRIMEQPDGDPSNPLWLCICLK